MEVNNVKFLQKLVPKLYTALDSLYQWDESTTNPSTPGQTCPIPSPLLSPKTRLQKYPEIKKRKGIINDETSRKIWVKEENLQRDTDGFFATTFEDLYTNKKEEFKDKTGMSPQVFDMLSCLVIEQLNKHSIRTPIAPQCRLFLTLNFLANAERILPLSKAFKMGPSTVRAIVQETCDILWTTLGPAFMPQTSLQDYQEIVKDYEMKYDVPHCLGGLDVKRLEIAYKGNNDIFLLASCNADLIFTNFDLGFLDFSDNRISWQDDFGWQLLRDELPGNILPTSNEGNSYSPSFIANDSFPKRKHLTIASKSCKLDSKQTPLNQNLLNILDSTIEKAFSVLMHRWRILSGPMHMSPWNAEKAIRAAVVLHNFVKQHDETYCLQHFLDGLPPRPERYRVPSIWLRCGDQSEKRSFEFLRRESNNTSISNEDEESNAFNALINSGGGVH